MYIHTHTYVCMCVNNLTFLMKIIMNLMEMLHPWFEDIGWHIERANLSVWGLTSNSCNSLNSLLLQLDYKYNNSWI
jgi:hypothetical protein